MARHCWTVLRAVGVLAVTAAGVSAQPAGRMMGMGHDSATMAHMQAIHALIMNHDRIVRTVSDLPDGVRTVTESNDPLLARQIRTHVAEMYRLLATGVDPGLPHSTEALHTLLRKYDKIVTSMDTTAKGIIVVQTSTDPAVVALLRQHAAEVTEMVRGGMAALHQGMMPGAGPDSGFSAMQRRGREVMGVDQYTSTHQFDLLADGGRIELQRNGDDSAGVAQIRAHLLAIADAFTSGDFSAPAAVHLQRVPGTEMMTARRDAIRFTYGELPRGGEVRIVTKDPVALKAIHEFVEFQRHEHRATGAGEPKHPG